jgi:hypothetical protein
MENTPQLLSNKVLIVGKGPGWELASNFYPSDYNIWTIPQGYSLLSSLREGRTDLVFEIHSPDQWRRKKATLHQLNALYTTPKLIVPVRVSPWTTNSYLLPVEELKKMGLPLLNSFAWMIVYALYRGVDTLAFRGVNLDFAHESATERDGMIYLLGYLKAKGISLDIENTSGLLKGNGIWNLNS